ncbi:hypothetical protein OIU84_026143 [Salix udensis]|uniref:Uncharacterized protein n=1 Tax=Salix udensis TaxID=889485 RepID=A0AAD6PEE4_9ROSI|nr:hypothetical protein OIU84_026143 [Salix udensis]
MLQKSFYFDRYPDYTNLTRNNKGYKLIKTTQAVSAYTISMFYVLKHYLF